MGFQVQVEGGLIPENFGHVVKQEPEAGKPVQQGQQVRITCRQ
jgi:beta-lactam-binding protein with PASTA domain